jgi:hypothetical protein
LVIARKFEVELDTFGLRTLGWQHIILKAYTIANTAIKLNLSLAGKMIPN